MASVGVIFAPLIARLVRAEVLRARESLYVEALRSLGVPQRRILLRHMIPNSIQPVIVQSSLVLAYALIAEASLSFLGFGVQPPDPSWGGMLGRAYASINQHAWQIYVPGLAITLTVLSINTLGNYLRRSLLRTID
jgi:peptide/nickel transport system permease protein